jgi:hypothetical protein
MSYILLTLRLTLQKFLYAFVYWFFILQRILGLLIYKAFRHVLWSCIPKSAKMEPCCRHLLNIIVVLILIFIVIVVNTLFSRWNKNIEMNFYKFFIAFFKTFVKKYSRSHLLLSFFMLLPTAVTFFKMFFILSFCFYLYKKYLKFWCIIFIRPSPAPFLPKWTEGWIC